MSPLLADFLQPRLRLLADKPTPVQYLRRVRSWLTRHLLLIVLLAVLCYLIADYVLLAHSKTYYFDGIAIDGPFQLFNALRRLEYGQWPGADFPFFHGIGQVYLHAPLYVALGRNLFASEMSRWLVSILTSIAASWLLLRAFRLSKETSLLLTVLVHVPVVVGTLQLVPVVLPGNSLLGPRSFLPIVSISVLLCLLQTERLSGRWHRLSGFIEGVLRRKLPPWWGGAWASPRFGSIGFVLSAAFLAAACILSGTEHGLAFTAALISVSFAFPIIPQPLRLRVQWLGLFVGGLVVWLLVLSAVMTGGHPLAALAYNLGSVPQDQFWYFASTPGQFIADLTELFLRAEFLERLALAVGLLLFLVSLRRSGQNKLLSPAELWGALTLTVYGLLSAASFFGIATIDYTAPMWRVLSLLLLILAARAFLLLRAQRLLRLAHLHFSAVAVTGLLALLVASDVATNQANIADLVPKFASNSIDQGVLLSTDWTQTMILNRLAMGEGQLNQGQVWSTYAGIFEADARIFQPDTDYIIHALGHQRRVDYATHFAQLKPEYATTIRIDYSGFERWIQDTSWPFYETLLEQYDLKTASNHTLIWQRQRNAPPSDQQDSWTTLAEAPVNSPMVLRIDANDRPEDADAVVTVKVEYEVANPYKVLPFVGSLPRYLLTIEQSKQATKQVSLPPYETSWEFPVFLASGVDPVITSSITPRFPKMGLKIRRISYRLVNTDPANVKALLTGTVTQPVDASN